MGKKISKQKTWTFIKKKISSNSPLDYEIKKGGIFHVFIVKGNTTFFENLYPPGFRNVVGITKTNDADYQDFVDNYKGDIDGTPPNNSELVTVKEESIQTGGRFNTKTFAVDCSASTGIFYTDVSFPIPISLMEASFQSDDANAGDILMAYVAPDAIVGTLTAAAGVDDNVLNVSQTVVDNVKVGFYIKVTDGVNTDDLGIVTAIDKTNLTISTDKACLNSFDAGSYVKQTIEMMNIELIKSKRYMVGDSKIGGSPLPANTNVRLSYDNKSGTAKRFVVRIEWLY